MLGQDLDVDAAYERCVAALAQADDATRSDRAARLLRLWSEGDPEGGRLFPGGHVPAVAFSEAVLARPTFEGLFLATILLAQSCLEHVLAGVLVMADPARSPSDRPTMAALLRDAREAGVLNEEDFRLFERLRRSRNPYAHPRGIFEPETPLSRGLAANQDLETLMEDDAWSALQALVRLMNGPRLAMGELRLPEPPGG